MRRACAAIAAIAIAFSPMRASAQSDVEQARIYYDAGAQAYAAGRYDAAVEAFTAAYALAQRPAVLFSLAQAERRQFTAARDPRHLRDAVDHFRKYLAIVPEGGRRVDAVEALADLEATAARLDLPVAASVARRASTRLMISTTTKGAVVTLDGVAHTEIPWLQSVAPGPHKLRVEAPGYFEEEREIVAVEGALVPFEITLRERPSLLALDAPAGAFVTIDGRPFGEAPIVSALELSPGAHLVTITRTGYEPRVANIDIPRGETVPLHMVLPRTKQRRVAYAVLGTGALTLLGSGGLALGALHMEGVTQGILDEGRAGNLTAARLADHNAALATRDRLRTASLAMLGVTGALGLTGLGLYFFDDPRPALAPPARGAAVRVGAASVGLVGSF